MSTPFVWRVQVDEIEEEIPLEPTNEMEEETSLEPTNEMEEGTSFEPTNEMEEETSTNEREEESPPEATNEMEEEAPLEPTKALVKRIHSQLQLRKRASEVEKQRKQIHAEAESDDDGPVSPVVKICCVVGATALICLFWYIYYSINQSMRHDADLQAKIMAGDKMATLNTVKMHTIQSHSAWYQVAILVIVLCATGLLGYFVFNKDISRHSHDKRTKLARMASDAIIVQERIVTDLKVALNVQMIEVTGLTEKVTEYKQQIEKQEKMGRKNEEEIKRLRKQKLKKEGELRAAGVKLKSMVECYEEAKVKIKKLQDDKDEKEQSIKALEQVISDGKAKLKVTEADLRWERSLKEASHQRESELATSQEQYREEIQKLKIKKKKLKVQKKHLESEKERLEEAERQREEESSEDEQETAESDAKKDSKGSSCVVS